MPIRSVRSQRGVMTMNKISRESMFRRAVIAVSATFMLTVLAGSVRADHVEQGLGVLLGGIVGGSIGSAIGKGNGRRLAIGVGSALGALYGGEVAADHRPARRNAYYAPPRHLYAPAVVRYHPEPIPVYVQPSPVYATPPRAAETSITMLPSGGGLGVARHKPASITECRLLEDGLAPVYGCRDTHGNWRILR